MTTEQSLQMIAVCQLVLTVAGVVSVAVLVFAIVTIKKLINDKVEEALAKVQPVLDQAIVIAKQAKNTAEIVSTKVDSIAIKAEITASKVSDTVQSVTDRFDKALSPQVMAAVGVVGAAAKALELFRQIGKIRKESVAHKDQHSV